MTPIAPTTGMPFAHLAHKSTDDAQAGKKPLRPKPGYNPLRVSALAFQYLGDEGVALDAAYQMIQIIQRLLHEDDFVRLRAFAAAAFHPDHATEGEAFHFTQMRWSRAADKHLGEERLSEELQTAHLMMHCIKDLLTADEFRRFLTFVEAAYGQPSTEPAAS